MHLRAVLCLNLLQVWAVSAAGVEEFKDIFLECCGLDLEANPAYVDMDGLGCGGTVTL